MGYEHMGPNGGEPLLEGGGLIGDFGKGPSPGSSIASSREGRIRKSDFKLWLLNWIDFKILVGLLNWNLSSVAFSREGKQGILSGLEVWYSFNMELKRRSKLADAKDVLRSGSPVETR